MNMPAIYQSDIVKIAKQWKFVLGILLQSPGILEFSLGGISSRTQGFYVLMIQSPSQWKPYAL